ncbi:MAG: aminoglycoside 6-adenylyltransferase, partial [Muribaculaceae bacterium]|nr:aminoglycoside 6-adenylyltransferase [Muribaculaceae bacterium]
MAVLKNQIPILEFDTEQSAVIMPGHHSDYHFPQKGVMLFMEPEIDDFVAHNECEVIGKFVSVTKDFYVYKTQINNIDIAFVQAPLGGAGAVQIMEQLIAGGVKEIIAAGCCGALVEDTEGSFFIPTAALRQEGTSYHYLPPSREVELDAAPIKAICKVLENAKLSYRTCKTWTTDGFYRETKEMVQYRKSEGYAVVEMECASMAACAKMRGILFGQVLFTADSLADVDAHDERNWGNDFFAAAMKIAMEAITEVCMRAENEMYDLILGIAKNDVRIKAVYMNGSRTNDNV